MRLLLLLELTLLFPLADIGLEVFELFLRGSLAFLVVINWFRNGLNGSIADRDQDRLIILALLLSP